MLKSFNKSTRIYTSKMQSQILPISISNPFIPNRTPPPSTMPPSAASHAGAVFMNSIDYNGDDLAHSSIEDGKKFETKPFIPRVSSHDAVDGVLPLSAASSVSYQQRRRRAASDSNLSDLRGGRRRFFWNSAGRSDGEKFSVTRFGAKVLGYISSGYRLITGFLSLQCYAFLIMPGVLQGL